MNTYILHTHKKIKAKLEKDLETYTSTLIVLKISKRQVTPEKNVNYQATYLKNHLGLNLSYKNGRTSGGTCL